MFKCLECQCEGDEFHAEVAKFDQGTYLYWAKCPKCGSTKIDAIGSIKEQDLRISIKSDN